MTTHDKPRTYGELISTIVGSSDSLRSLGDNKLSRKAAKRLQTQLRGQLGDSEQAYVNSGVNFSRTQVNIIRQHYVEGRMIEFETIGPYLANYLHVGGKMTLDNLIPEDVIGVRLAVLLRSIFPKARLVSLCDEYNGSAPDSKEAGISPAFTSAQKQRFLTSLTEVLTKAGAIPPNAEVWREYLLLSESDNVAKAERLIAMLEASGYIEHTKDALYFVNPAAENPLHRRFCLRTPRGHWLCETLDAAGFLDPVNMRITHLIVLPEYMKVQQDRVWEILRVLGLTPAQHHNLFFDPSQPVEAIVSSVARAFSRN